MARTQPRRILAAALILVAVGMLVPASFPVPAQSSYQISVPDAVDVPDRDVTVDGDEFTITEVSQVSKGADIRASIDAPEDQTYSVELYNYKSQEENIKRTTGPSDVSFSTDDLPPGPYYLAVVEGDFRDVYPVVVKGYDVEIDVPSSVQRGRTAEVSGLTERAESNAEVSKVQLVVGDELRRITVSESEGSFTATISTDDLEPGEYPIYGVVRGEKETDDGEKIIHGLSSRQTLTVEESTPTETDSSDSSGSTGGSTGGTGGSTDDTTPTATPTPTPPPTDTEPTATDQTPETRTESPTESATERSPEPSRSPTASPSPTPSPTDDGVITPVTPTDRETTPSSTPTTTAGQPGFGVVAALLAVTGLLALRRR